MDTQAPPRAEIVGRFLRKRGTLMAYWCPGCEHVHILNVDAEERPRWGYDNNAELPTFSPSVKVSWPGNQDRGEVVRCHSFVQGGRINFLDDSSGHKLRGWHPMVVFPEGYAGWSD